MPTLVVDGALISCDAGRVPATLVVPRRVARNGPPLAAVSDHTPGNIRSFTFCESPANPAVVAARAQGSPAPVQCEPTVPAPWSPGTRNVTLANPPKRRLAALTSDSTCRCALGGTIKIIDPGTHVRVD